MQPTDAIQSGGGLPVRSSERNATERPSAPPPVDAVPGADIASSPPFLLTIALEDYFQVGAFNRVIQRGQWYRFEARVEVGAHRALDLLDEYDIKATFFVLGWVADQAPELVREIALRGHEVASKGYYHRSISQLSRNEFREDLARAREALERASGQRVWGYRVAHDWFGPADLWALDVLAEEGYRYDSSLGVMLRRFASEPWRRLAHEHRHGPRTLLELPISAVEVGGLAVPVAGGNYFRQLPQWFVRRAIDRWQRTCPAPFVMYFHTWELDPHQPRITAASWIQHLRQYRHLDRMPAILRSHLSRYPLTSVANYLGLPVTDVQLRLEPPTVGAGAGARTIPFRRPDQEAVPRTPVTIVVPCYNEEQTLPYLANTLRSVQAGLAAEHDLQLVFVDDRSTDGTWATLQRLFGARTDVTLVRHDVNRGVAAGILTGIQHARTEIVCSIDCDCTYDPHELVRMVPLLTDDVDMVVASPYHPDGRTLNVPRWRLLLSRAASRMYRVILRQPLHTFTSCFRVYRRSAVLGLAIERSGFLGIAEMLGRMDLAGARIVEHPATLEVRVLGHSKLKVARTVAGHISLMMELLLLRLTGRGHHPPGGPRRSAA